MGYAGGMLDTNVPPEQIGQVYGFLQAALREVEPERPYRGPGSCIDGPWTYRNGTHATSITSGDWRPLRKMALLFINFDIPADLSVDSTSL